MISSRATVGIKIAHVVYTMATALLAGLLFAFQQSVIPALRELNGPDYVRIEQLLIINVTSGPLALRTLALIGMVLPLYPLIALRRQRQLPFWRWTLAGWVLFVVGSSIFTLLLNIPINNAVLAMDPAHPPPDWHVLRDRWNLFNAIRTPITAISLVAYLIAGLYSPSAAPPQTVKEGRGP